MKKLLVMMSVVLMSAGGAMAMSRDGDGSRENSYITHMQHVTHSQRVEPTTSDLRYSGRTVFGDGSVENRGRFTPHHSVNENNDHSVFMNEMHYGDGSPSN